VGARWAWRAAAFAMAGMCAATAVAAADGGGEEAPTLAAWIAPGGDAAAPPWLALLGHPPGWTSGDAAVVLVPDGDWPPGAREALRAALLGAGAAVLDMPPHPPGPPGAGLSDAVQAVRRDKGAGLVVVIGRGAAPLDLPAAPPVAALIRLGPGAPGIVPGEVPPAEDWPRRAPLLCDLLAAAPLPDVPDLAAACRAALPGAR